MDIIYKKRCRGKTTDLIRLSAETGYPIVAVDAWWIRTYADKLGIKIPRPISIWDIKSGEIKPDGKVLVDELEYVVKYLVGLDIDTATLSSE